jgi:hypothetical protein
MLRVAIRHQLDLSHVLMRLLLLVLLVLVMVVEWLEGSVCG